MQTMTRENLHRWMDQGQNFVLVETLPAKHFRKAHLPGAINVPVDDARFAEKIRNAAPQNERPIVVYCADSDCPESVTAARVLDRMGYRAVFDYAAGKAAWREAGYHLERGV